MQISSDGHRRSGFVMGENRHSKRQVTVLSIHAVQFRWKDVI
jgi:hypothetical protein